MGSQDRIPTKDADFNNYVNIVIPYLNNNKARLVITTSAQTNLTSVTALLSTAVTGWNSVYLQNLNGTSDSTTVAANKKLLRKQLTTGLRSIYADIPRSVLTQADRDTLNINLPAEKHSSAVKPTSVPSITVSGRGHLSANISILDVEGSRAVTKVEDAEMIELEAAFLAPGATPAAGFPTDKDFHHAATLGRSTTTRSYTSDQLRGVEYLKARYLNSRKEPGGWSEVVSIVVS